MTALQFEAVVKRVAARLMRKGLPAFVERDDLEQEGRLRVWQMREQLAGLPTLQAEALAAHAARHAMIDHIRRLWPGGRNGGVDVTSINHPDQAEPSTPDTTSSHAQVQQLLERLLPRMKGNRRAVLEALVEGLTWPDTGRVTGLSEATISHHRVGLRGDFGRWI